MKTQKENIKYIQDNSKTRLEELKSIKSSDKKKVKIDVFDIFYENWDGDMVLSGTSNFKNEEDFLEQAQIYVNKTHGDHILVNKINVEVTSIIVNGSGEWIGKTIAEDEGFRGREITVYRTDLVPE